MRWQDIIAERARYRLNQRAVAERVVPKLQESELGKIERGEIEVTDAYAERIIQTIHTMATEQGRLPRKEVIAA